ncbi:hypothetical protein BC833DRAFT_656359 [Globomyces pollinis-pini]|nr:hypothetical protein BC833DRAFT_656359 [Globomyces pollinis-pini]
MSLAISLNANNIKDLVDPDDFESVIDSSKTLASATTGKKKESLNQKKAPNCYGRVQNLEEMIPEQWWKTVFSDDMYLKTDGDVVEDADITKAELIELTSDPDIQNILLKGCQPQDETETASGDGHVKVLDLCCGQGRHSLHLVHEYSQLRMYGHDQSSYLISLAKERAVEQKVTKQTCFTVGDCRQIPYPDATFDLILLLGNSFGYFSNDDQDRAVLREIFRVLLPNGRVVIDLTDGDYMRENFAERSWEWIDDSTFVCRERQLSKDKARLNSREIVTMTGDGVVRDQFYQERLYSRNDLNKLMREAGFSVVIPPSGESGSLTLTQTLSKRNEDLGMMENRMIITAVKPDLNRKTDLQLSAAPKLTSLIPKISILMGDTRKPCVGKLNNTWNDEDLLTRNKLIEGIRKNYDAEWIDVLDCHDTLVESLVRRNPAYVFNLCDEGWNNDALKELHLPALLEMLDIPYSGAGPNCLAFCYDKGLVNRSASAIGIPTPKEVTFLGNSQANPESQLKELIGLCEGNLEYPVFVKPIKGDNSLGITVRSVVKNPKELTLYVQELRELEIYDILIQEYLEGIEYGVGMIGNVEAGFHFLPTLKVDFTGIISKQLPPILGFESKWDPKSPYWSDVKFEKAHLDDKTELQLQKHCIQLWERFGCRDYARFDFRSDSKGEIKLLEVNPNPGWCWDGKLAYMAKLDGLDYHELLDLILKASWKRLGLYE